MLSKILKQLWNQRRMNVWIFIELVAAAFFLWTTIDPLYLLGVAYSLPNGYEKENRYVISMAEYQEGHSLRDTTISYEKKKALYMQIISTIRDLPQVESFSVVDSYSYPASPSYILGAVFADTTRSEKSKRVGVRQFFIYSDGGGDYCRTMGLRDVRTGDYLRMPADFASRGLCAISASVARELFGTTNVVGRKIREGEIAGVFEDIKYFEFSTPEKVFVTEGSTFWGEQANFVSEPIMVKLKDGVDGDAFVRFVHEEVAERLKVGNYYLRDVRSLDDYLDRVAEQNGHYNTIRLQTALVLFVMVCIFLGTLGTFWIRVNARRQEIGLLRSFGASKKSVVRQFLTESALLLSIAYVVAMVGVGQYILMSGMATLPQPHINPDEVMAASWLFLPFPHFCLVTVAGYLLLLCTSLIGTYIPVSRASKILPAEALRDE